MVANVRRNAMMRIVAPSLLQYIGDGFGLRAELRICPPQCRSVCKRPPT